MNSKQKRTRTVDIYSAGCAICEKTVKQIKQMSCPSCHVTILDMHEPSVVEQAQQLGIRSLPAVVIDGKLADCCAGRGMDEAVLRATGIGQPLSA